MDPCPPTEETGLLTPTSTSTLSSQKRRSRPATPLPHLQIWVVLVLQICEPITSQSIYPYINQLVSELDITGGDDRRVGYYAGLIESLFFATEAITVLHWSRLSDIVGRKPVLMIGLVGSAISMLSFGLSRTFWALVISRCVTGLLNGNIGVMKSVMGDLTDPSNRAEGFALMPVVWSFGATMGPLIGGTFARPHERFPEIFSSAFWEQYPYFLPCLVSSFFVFVSFLITLVLFKETVPKHRRRSRSYDSIETQNSSKKRNEPVPLRGLLIFPVLISVANYVTLAFLNIAFNALFPLFLAMPPSIGGLGMPPSTIGYIMGVYGASTGIFQFFFFAKIVRGLGERRVFINGMLALPLMFALFPIISFCGGTPWIWVGIACIIMLSIIMDMSYGAIFMFITASAPSKASLGATNGLSQTTASIARAIGPALATSLFSLSVEKNVLGGYGAYALFVVLSVLALSLAVKLPMEIWEEDDE
ncbi:MFS general substrate transporter [Armillaria gallica]|uniref:MFS general substrate transporter n=1 Tax=Armillaria gallica TaxID=47427 RepID=A0A2H3E9Z3_ARMGA|nr:MFS general substrate transporter [Armillaria gallica]